MVKENRNRYLQFMLIILAAGSIYPLIYLKAQYQETMLQVFGMTNQELNSLYAILGMVFIVGYFPSGMLCDRFSAKKLLSISLLGTSLGGFWFAQVPTYSSVVIIFAIWGFFSVFTFWGAHLKVVKMLSTAEQDGRFFGILDSGRGLVEAVLASIALAIFTNRIGDGADVVAKTGALVPVIYMYSIVLLVISVLIFVFVKEDHTLIDAKDENNQESKFKLSHLGQIFKNKFVWFQGIIIFAGYTLYWTNYYFGGYLQTNIEVAPATVGSVMVAVLWMRPIGGLVGGIMADKVGKSITIAMALLVGSLCLLVMAIAPSTLPVPFFSGLVVITGLVLYIIRGTYWSLLGESKIDALLMGTAIGMISFIGYLPDILIPYLNTALWDNLSPVDANKAYFLISMGVGLVGMCFALIYKKAHEKENAK